MRLPRWRWINWCMRAFSAVEEEEGDGVESRDEMTIGDEGRDIVGEMGSSREVFTFCLFGDEEKMGL